jgi:hypothetical protein
MPEKTITQDEIDQLLIRQQGQINLAGYDLSGIDFRKRTLKNIIFSDYHNKKISNLTKANFNDCTIEDVRFSGAILENTSFRNCKILWCDFRYIKCSQSTFQDAYLYACDFYRASFGDYTIFDGAILVVSLYMANMLGAGVRKENLPYGLLQENKNLFEEFHEHFSFVPKDQISTYIEKRHRESMLIYKYLSGLWTSQGMLQDAGWAYVQSKRYERRTISPIFIWKTHKQDTKSHQIPYPGLHRLVTTLKYLPKYFGYWFVDAICGFGENIWRVILSILCLIGLSAIGYWSMYGLVDQNGIPYTMFVDYLIFSMGNLTSTSFGDYIPADKLIEFLISVQSLIGITLVGLFGFILGNKIRSS